MRTARSILLLGALLPALLLGCDGGAGAPRGAGQGVEVAMSPPTARVEVGGTVAFAAEVTGTVDASVAWDVVEADGGIVDQHGAYTAAGAPGAFHVRATSRADPTKQGVASVEVVGTIPDPTLLPVATTAQVPLTGDYDALGVPALAAGESYLDPTTGVTIYKLTSSTYPTSSAGWVHDYAEGGNEISLPYRGQTRAILVRAIPSLQYWLIDFTLGLGLSNARKLTGSLAPWMDLAFTFSSNPATPWYAYVSNGSSVVRLDIRTMTAAPGDGWPVADASATWLHQSESDGLFVWMRGANGSTAVAYEPATATLKTYTNADLNEPRIDRAGRYVGMNMSTGNAGVIWDFTTASEVWRIAGDPGIPFAHIASLRHRWMGVDWNETWPSDFTSMSPEPNSAVHVGKPSQGGGHGSGNWNQHPPDLGDQWALFYYYGALRPSQDYWLSPGGMVLITQNGERRLLGHPYNTSKSYGTFSFCKLSPDGRFVLFTSDMDGSSRSDLFLAAMPAR